MHEHELIHTTVAPPVWMGDQIRRDSLLAELDRALDRRLTVIHAPAGYGKTSLLSQWRDRHEDESVVLPWLTIESDASDPLKLCRYLALALDRAAHAGTDDDYTGAADLPPRAALSALVARLAREPRHVVLILDDWHRADSDRAGDFLAALIRLAPENCRFVVASREYPHLGQSVLAAEDQLLELGAGQLRFSLVEAQALLSRGERAEITGIEVESIVERTEGWPIALQLTALSLRRGVDRQLLVRRLGGPSSDLGRYLSEQVLMTLPAETQEIVIRTAMLDRLTGEAVNLLCDRDDGWLILEQLEEQGVFLTPLTPERTEYRYHQLFAEYMRERLARRDTAKYRMLRRRAAEWYAGRGEIVEAIRHAIEADHVATLASILEVGGGWRLIPQGHQASVERALASLPEDVVASRPLLLLAKVYLEIKCGELASARARYDRFVGEMADSEIAHDLRTELRVVGDTLADYENLPVALSDLLERETLLRTLPADDHLVLANFTETLAAKYYEGGWLERAMEPVLRAREHYEALGLLYSELFTRFLEARIRRAQGRLEDAAAILGAAQREIDANFGERSDLAANCAAFRAELLFERNGAEEADELLEWALPHMEGSDGWVDVYTAAYFTAARIAADRGELEEARAVLARARRLADRRRLRQLSLLTGLCELELLIDRDAQTKRPCVLAEQIELDAHADAMEEESPLYRPVAVAAALCRAKMTLDKGDHAAALLDLRRLRAWAGQRGAGRLAIDANILAAYALRIAGKMLEARALFDEAVSMAMFQRLERPFIDFARFARPLLEEAIDRTAPADRFRQQFLKSIAGSIAGRIAAAGGTGPLNEAESEILHHLSCGYANKEIARLIGKSPDTVKYRLKAIYKKIGVHKRRDAVRVAHERGLVGEKTAPS